MPLLVTRAFMNKKDKAFLSNTHIYYSKGFLQRKGENCILNIFSEVKEYLTARQVAENYGLQVRRNGLACCPFHDDKHPSMKIDKNYHCFACGVGGDAVDYVSRMFGLSQYEAALKIVEDFRLPVEVKGNKELSEQDRERICRERTERERLIHIRERFDRWCNQSIESLRDGLSLIEQTCIFLNGKP